MNDYIEERVKIQRQWYEQKATENKKTFFSYQTIIIILGAIIPVMVAFESVVPFLKEYGGPISAVISAIISIYAGLDKLKQPQPNWFNFRANEESLKKEEWLYKYKAGPYKNLLEKEARIQFVERVESIISSDITRTMTLGGKDQEDDQNNRMDDTGTPSATASDTASDAQPSTTSPSAPPSTPASA